MQPDDPKSPPPEESFAALFSQNSSQSAQQRRLSRGQEIEATVVKVTNDAVFVDLDGKREAFIEGQDLLDPAGNRIELQVGARVTARVVELGGRSGGVRLKPIALRKNDGEQGEPGTVEVIGAAGKDAMVVGAKVKTVVSRIEPYGCFLQVEGSTDPKARGLLPMAETTLKRGTDPHKHFTVGQQLEVKVAAIDEQGRVRFSLKAMLSDEERERFEQFRKEEGKGREGKAGFGTLGDLLGKAGAKAYPAKAPSAKKR